jgi:hypothetical protein
MSELDDIIQRKEPPVESAPEAEQETPKEAPETTEEAPKQEAEQEAPKAETPEVKAEEPPAQPDPTHVPIPALLDEREKRQESERRYAELQKELETLKASNATPENIPDPLEDPEGFGKAMLNQAKSLVEEAKRETQATLLNWSEASARSRHADWEDMAKVFGEAAQENPALRQQLLSQPDPGEWVYQQGKKLHAINNTPDLDALEAQIRAKIEAEMKAEAAAKAGKLDAVPESLTDTTSSTPPAKEPFQPASLDDILKR